MAGKLSLVGANARTLVRRVSHSLTTREQGGTYSYFPFAASITHQDLSLTPVEAIALFLRSSPHEGRLHLPAFARTS